MQELPYFKLGYIKCKKYDSYYTIQILHKKMEFM